MVGVGRARRMGRGPVVVVCVAPVGAGRPCRDRVVESKGRKLQGSIGPGGAGVAHDSHVLSLSSF